MLVFREEGVFPPYTHIPLVMQPCTRELPPLPNLEQVVRNPKRIQRSCPGWLRSSLSPSSAAHLR